MQFDWKFTGTPGTQYPAHCDQFDAAPMLVLAYNYGVSFPFDADWEQELNHSDTDTIFWDAWCDFGESPVLSPNTWYTIDMYLWQESPCVGDNFVQIDVDGVTAILDCGNGAACPFGDYPNTLVVGIPWDVEETGESVSHWIDNVRWWYDDNILFQPYNVSPCCE